MVEVQHLLQLNDFKELDQTALVDLAEHAVIDAHKKKHRLLAKDYSHNTFYLIEGQIKIQSEGGLNQSFDNTAERAQDPVFRLNIPGLMGCCVTPCKFLNIDNALIKKYVVKKSKAPEDMIVEELDAIIETSTETSLVKEILNTFNGNKVQLPSLPEIAIHISSAIEDDDVSFKQLASLIQIDPGVTAHIIQVANSALYGGKKVNSIPNAISKLGLRSVHTVVMCVVMRELFPAKNRLIKKAMLQFYEHSIRIGVICYDLAKRIPGMNPDHGFLVGLLHDIGCIPILVIADGHPELAKQAGHLETTLQQLKGHIGYILLKQWQFSDEYAYIAKHAYDWDRKTAKADYCDLVQVALLHEQFVGGKKYHAPALSNLPAFKRLNMDEVNPADNIQLLNDLNKRIKDMINVLCH